MILSQVASCKVVISRTILNMEIPFKLSQLYEKGLVDYASVEDDTLEYESNFGHRW